MSKYACIPKNYVWLSGYGCVYAMEPEELNKYIDEWNNHICKFAPYDTTFFDWLSYERGTEYKGIAFCNQNTNFKTIKAANGGHYDE